MVEGAALEKRCTPKEYRGFESLPLRQNNFNQNMSTKQSTVDFILDQLQPLEVAARKMFGEYALYYQEKVVALVCDETLFVKITEPGKNFVGKNYQEGPPYPGAKPYMIIDNELIEDNDWLAELIQITAENLPAPKPKKVSKTKNRV